MLITYGDVKTCRHEPDRLDARSMMKGERVTMSPRATEGPEGDEALTRRRLLGKASAVGVTAVGGAAVESLVKLPEVSAAPPPARPSTPAQALQALLAGNRRYVGGNIKSLDYNRLGNRIAETQKPFAAIIACADSRVSPPDIFDVGQGNIFVSRVAGNSIDSGTLGSTEYAVKKLHVLLVMVLGHSNCGAVSAAIEIANGTATFPRQKYGAIGTVIRPIMGPVRAIPRQRRTLPRCVAANARAQAARFAATGPIIAPEVGSGHIRVVAAVYDIRTGAVSVV
jgi:carbonic anhydrase